jgi:hypothetical protein
LNFWVVVQFELDFKLHHYQFLLDKQIETSASMERMFHSPGLSSRSGMLFSTLARSRTASSAARPTTQRAFRKMCALSAPLPSGRSMLTKKGNCDRGVLANVALASHFNGLPTDEHLSFTGQCRIIS